MLMQKAIIGSRVALCLVATLNLRLMSAADQASASSSSTSGVQLVVQRGHSAKVTSVAFAHNGKLAVTASEDGTVIVWEVGTQRELRRILGHTAPVVALAVANDGNTIATGSDDKTARVWDVRTGQCLATFQHPGKVTSVAFSPDGRFLLTGERDFMARLWSIADSKENARFRHPQWVSAVAFSPNGRWILTGSWDGIARLWSAETKKMAFAFKPDHGWVRSVAFSADSTLAVVGSGDVSIWNTGTGECARRLAIEKGWAQSMQVSRDGAVLAAIVDDIPQNVIFDKTKAGFKTTGTPTTPIHVWETTAWKEIARIPRSPQSLSTDLSIEGRTLLTGNQDGTASLVDLDQQGDLGRFYSNIDIPTSVANHSSKTSTSLLIGTRQGSIDKWDLNSTSYSHLSGHSRQVNAIASFEGTNSVVSASDDHSVCIWDIEAGKCERRLKLDPDPVIAVAAASDGSFFITGGEDKRVRFWHTADGAEFGVPLKTCDTIQALAISTDSQLVASGEGQEGGVSTFDVDGRMVFNPCLDYPVRIWDVATRRERVTRINDSEFITSTSFSKDGQRLLSSTADGVAEMWKVKDKSQVSLFTGHEGAIASARLSRDEKLVMTSGSDKTVRVWDANSGKELHKFLGHEDSVVGGIFLNQPRFAASVSLDRTTKIWDVRSMEPVATIVGATSGAWDVAAADGRFDSNTLEGDTPLHWIADDNQDHALPLEIFMRDYYEPRLLPRLLECRVALEVHPDACQKEFPAVRQLADLNRVQPGVEIVSVKEGSSPDLAEVTVEVSPADGEFQRDGKTVKRHTDVYDLRLFRGGQLVGQEPELSPEVEASLKNGVVLTPEELNDWKTVRQVKPVAGRVTLDAATGKLRRTFTVRVPHGQAGKEIQFTAYAFNEDRVKSQTAPHAYTVPADAGPVKRRAYVITMGVNAYENADWDLHFGASDAKLMRDALVSRLKNQQYEVVPVTLVSDCKDAGCPEDGDRGVAEDHASRAALHAVLEALSGHTLSAELKNSLPPGGEKVVKAQPDDLVILTVSSHGYTSKEGMFYIVPSDSGKTDGHGLTEELRHKWISSDELSAWLRDVDAGDLAMIVDTCHSASTVEEPGFKPGPMGSRGLGQLAYDKGMQILAASQANDVALESEKLKQGLLTYALVHDGLAAKQAADPTTKKITLDGWLQYGVDRVPTLYQQVLAGKVQTFAEGSKDVSVNEHLSGGTSSIRKAGAFQQPSLFNFQKSKNELILQ